MEEEVRSFYESLPDIIKELNERKELFTAGQTKYKLEEWKNITTDETVTNLISGVEIDFTEEPPCTAYVENRFSKEESLEI